LLSNLAFGPLMYDVVLPAAASFGGADVDPVGLAAAGFKPGAAFTAEAGLAAVVVGLAAVVVGLAAVVVDLGGANKSVNAYDLVSNLNDFTRTTPAFLASASLIAFSRDWPSCWRALSA